MAYTQQQRDQAVALYLEHGLAEAHHRTGIPKASLQRWTEAAGHDLAEIAGRTADQTRSATQVKMALAEEKRADLRVKLLDRAQRMLDRMTEEEIDFRGKDADEVMFPEASAAACKSFATAAAILIDKFRLEAGEATSVTAVVEAPERTPEQEAEMAKVVSLAERRAA